MDSELVIYSGLGSIEGPKPLTESLALNNYWSKGVNAVLFLIFSAIALLLAAVGLYAVIAHSVSRAHAGDWNSDGGGRNGARYSQSRVSARHASLGNRPGHRIGRIIGRQSGSEIGAGRVSPSDPVTLIVASAVLILAAMLGCLIPARRAMRVDPMEALRHE